MKQREVIAALSEKPELVESLDKKIDKLEAVMETLETTIEEKQEEEEEEEAEKDSPGADEQDSSNPLDRLSLVLGGKRNTVGDSAKKTKRSMQKAVSKAVAVLS